MRLFCIPYAGVGASTYRGWAAMLPDEIEVNLLQLPGRENRLRETPFGRLEPLVDALALALRPFLDKPFAVFGHSMGALVAFEWIRQLRRARLRQPIHLFVSSRRAPHLAESDAPLHPLPEAEFVDGLRRRYNGIPRVVLDDAELMRIFLPTLRADLAVIETYVHADDEPLDCGLSAYGGRDDARVRAEDLAGWRDHTHGAFRMNLFPGDHFYLQTNRTEFLPALAQELSTLSAQLA